MFACILQATTGLEWTAMRWTRRHMPGMSGTITGSRHDEGSQPQAAPITRHKKEKPPSFCLARPVTRCVAQIPSSSYCMWRACAEKDVTDFWLLRDFSRGTNRPGQGQVSFGSSLSQLICSLRGRDARRRLTSWPLRQVTRQKMFLVGFCRCDVYPNGVT